MTYKEIVTYIEEIPRFTRKHSLDHTREMLLFLGNPQNGKKIIHVAFNFPLCRAQGIFLCVFLFGRKFLSRKTLRENCVAAVTRR